MDVSDALVQWIQEGKHLHITIYTLKIYNLDECGGEGEERRSFSYYISLFFPDENPIVWLVIHLGLIFLYFVMYVGKCTPT